MADERSFAAWVQPIAAQLAADRREVIAFARSAPADFWSRPAPVPGWTNKEILAHLAGGNDQAVQIVLRAVIAGETPPAWLAQLDTDGENARRIEERRRWTVDELIAELVRDGDEMQDLLSRLAEDDADARCVLTPRLQDFLRIVAHERHDHEHLQQMRSTMDGDTA